MKKSLITLTLITCLVLSGFLGSVYGQLNTVVPYGFLKQDQLGLNIELNNSNPTEYQNDYYFSVSKDKNINCGSKKFSGHRLSSDSVVILRTQLITHFEKGEIEEVKKIKNFLWDGQKVKGENLSYPEYWLLMFWTQEYDSFLVLKQQVNECTFQTEYSITSKVFQTELMYESLYPILQEKSRKFYLFLKDQINVTTKGEDTSFLQSLLDKLINTDAWLFNDVKIFRLNFYRKPIEKPLHSGQIDYSNWPKTVLQVTEKPSYSGLIDSHYYSIQNRLSRPTDHGGYGTGIYYQWGVYGGDTSNYISTHRVFYFPIVNFDLFIKRLVFQGFLGTGRFTVNGININGDNFKGTFCGAYFGISLAIGYEAYSNSSFSIIPNIGFQEHEYSVYAGADPGIIGNSNPLAPLAHFATTYYSFGFITDYKIMKMNVFNVFDKGYLAIRFKYDFCLTAHTDEYYNGNVQQFTFGLITTFRD